MLADDSTDMMNEREAALLRAKMLRAAADALDESISIDPERAAHARRVGLEVMRDSEFRVSEMPSEVGETLRSVIDRTYYNSKAVQENALREAAREISMNA